MLKKRKYKILVVVHSKLNRMVITSILEKDYFLEEASDGRQALMILEDHAEEFSLILLDNALPNMDGFQFLRSVKAHGWLDFLPVIMISSEYTTENIEKAFRLGASDIIQHPYNEKVIYHRIANTIALANKQRELSNALINEVIHENEIGSTMISVLSNLVEIRNGESGNHVKKIRTITRLLLEELVQETDQYSFSAEEMLLICTASSLHDIGKMFIPEAILNKPGKLTDAEYQIMKGHAMAGADMIDSLRREGNTSSFIQIAYEICRWHHERYDGRGYPDGLKGEEIPIAAQVVSVADVYDALVSERCYKPAYSPEQALQMILEGQCGVFNPLLMNCLSKISDTLKNALSNPELESLSISNEERTQEQIKAAVSYLHNDGTIPSDRLMQMMDRVRLRFKFFFNGKFPGFYFTVSPPVLCYNVEAMELFGVNESIVEPDLKSKPHEKYDVPLAKLLQRKLTTATNAHPLIKETITLNLPGEGPRQFRCEMQTIWDSPDAKCFSEVVGRLIPLEGEIIQTVSFDDRGKLPTIGSEMTGKEAFYLLSALKFMVHHVRLINPVTCNIVEVDQTGRLHKSDRSCYHIWQQTQRCTECISINCLASQKEFSKMVLIGREAFHVMAQYVKVDGTPLVLETLVRVTDDTILDQNGERLPIASISDMHNDMYIDPVTLAYNRRYYNTKALGPDKFSGLAVLNVDNFKEINNQYGRAVGDHILMCIAELINRETPKPDILVRYYGSEFVMMYASISGDMLESKLRKICDDIRALSIDGIEDGRHITVSIGGAAGYDIPAELLKKADEMLRKAKLRQGTVAVCTMEETK